MFKEPVLVVKSRRGSLQQQQQQQQLSGSLVSAVLDSASSASPRIYPLDPAGLNSIELVDSHNSNSLQHLQQQQFGTTAVNGNGAPHNNSSNQHKSKTHNNNSHTKHPNRSRQSNELCLVPATAPPYPNVLNALPTPQQTATGPSLLGYNRDSGVTSATSTATTSPSPTALLPHNNNNSSVVSYRNSQQKAAAAAAKAKEAQIVPETNGGIGRRLLNGFYDDFLDGLPFRRQPASTYCDPPARRFSLMGRAGTARNSEFKRNSIAQHRQRPLSQKLKSQITGSIPSYIRKGRGGPRRSSPGSGSSNMEFLRGVYAFMQVSRSAVNHVKVDSAVFRLHTNATVILLVTFSIAVTTRQYVGNPIDCVHTRDIPEDVLNTYCWIHSTYTVADAFTKKQGSEVPFPGVDNSQSRVNVTIKHTKYYQWVAFTLFFQAILFYTPRWLWKAWEGGKIHALMMDLDIGICSDMEKKQKKKLLIDYLWDNLRYHNWWAYRYFFCEFLTLINVIGQMFLMNRFFDGEFLKFGFKVIAHMQEDQEDRVDPMIYIFPRMTKCTFYKYGVSGEVERHDAICILPLNVVNEKIYIFLWFWFIILMFITTIILIYRVVIIFSPRMRVYLLRLRFRLVRRDSIEIIVRRSKMGDWFLLYMLGENIDTIIFRDIMQDLSIRLGHNQHHRVPGIKGDILDA